MHIQCGRAQTGFDPVALGVQNGQVFRPLFYCVLAALSLYALLILTKVTKIAQRSYVHVH